MDDRAKIIFGNVIPERDYRKALASRAKYLRRFGDDSDRDYPRSCGATPRSTLPWACWTCG